MFDYATNSGKSFAEKTVETNISQSKVFTILAKCNMLIFLFQKHNKMFVDASMV